MSFINFIVKHIETTHFPDRSRNELTVVDVGCGNGDQVYQLKEAGFNAYGCDLRFKKGEHVNLLSAGEYIRIIDGHYRLPFDNDYADIVYTNQVVEHVENIEEFFSEIYRIMKPGAVSVHCFPNINKPIEPHIKIPFASRIQSEKWIRSWTALGVPNIPERHWKDKGVEKMTDYLNRKTWYRSNKEVKKIAKHFFSEVWYDGNLFLQSISNHRKSKLFRALPGGDRVFNAIWTSLLLTKKHEADQPTETC